jgi:hypothetical protein
MNQTINHTIWLVDTGLRDFRHKSIPETLGRINGIFLSNCIGNVATDTIVSATARLAATVPITTARFDAVVFLVRNVAQSLAPRIGRSPTRALNDPSVLGTTFLGSPGGGLAEVYWERCFSDSEAASAIFHEAAHLKSGLGEAMHIQKVGARHGGWGLRVLTEKGGAFPFPSEDDLDFYSSAITKPILLRSAVPAP